MATVTLKKLRKTYGKTDVLHGLSFDVAGGEFIASVGPSGCSNPPLWV